MTLLNTAEIAVFPLLFKKFFERCDA